MVCVGVRKGTKDPKWGMVLGKGWRWEVPGTIRNRKTMWLEDNEQEWAWPEMEMSGRQESSQMGPCRS